MKTNLKLKTFLAIATGALTAAAAETLVFDQVETVGISGFRAHWNQPLLLAEDGATRVQDNQVTDRGETAVWSADAPGAIAFDALNRSLLVRFPGAAERIVRQLNDGFAIERVELVLPFLDEELWPIGGQDYIGPDGYNYRANWNVDRFYREIRPTWHAVAHVLRRPWTADGEIGPTFNAAINGLQFWARGGAADTERDRFPHRFGPTPVHYESPDGRMDVTALMTDEAFGATLGERLRNLSDRGFVVNKWETYDHRYFGGVYEWATATGGRAIRIRTPRLEVTLAPGAEPPQVELPAAADVADTARRLREDGPEGEPWAIIPTPEQLQDIAREGAEKPAWMSDWQWRRVRELYVLADPDKADDPFWYQFVPPHIIGRLGTFARDEQGRGYTRPAAPERVYEAWVDGLIGRQPRGWAGFESARAMTEWYLYNHAMAEPAREGVRRYWHAWLMPDRETAHPESARRDWRSTDGRLIHPMADDPRVGGEDARNPDPLQGRFDTYVAETGDWRGNKSFFRSGFNYTTSTQNFNTTAAAGALLAGPIVHAERAIEDGRHGLEHFPLRMWTWRDGSSQEHVDHYYFAHTLSGNKAFADFGPTEFDRLMGQSIMVKQVEELASAWHPGVRRFIAGASRTSLEYALAEQTGLAWIMHTLSPEHGAIRDGRGADLPGHMSPVSNHLPPQLAAMQTVTGPWGPDWYRHLVESKPLPYYASHSHGSTWRRAYMGRNYGLYSADSHGGRLQVGAHWRRTDRPAQSMRELVMMDVRYGINDTFFANSWGGGIHQPDNQAALQHENRLLVMASPRTWAHEGGGGLAGSGERRDDLTSLQHTIGLFNHEDPEPSWTIVIDGEPVGELPVTARHGQRIAIHDGEAFVGIIPLPGTDMGRNAEVILRRGNVQHNRPGSGHNERIEFQAALVIDNYNYRADGPMRGEDLFRQANRAWAGYYIELADADDHADFDAFQRHLAGIEFSVSENADDGQVSVAVSGAGQTMEQTVHLEPGDERPHIVHRAIDGEQAYPDARIQRDTSLVQQARGQAAKNGAALRLEDDRIAYLQALPHADIFAGYNPLPDLTTFELTVHGGIAVRADGRVSIAHVVVQPQANRVEIRHAFRPGQDAEDGTAREFILTGLRDGARIVFNGEPVENPARRDVDGQAAYLVPLR